MIQLKVQEIDGQTVMILDDSALVELGAALGDTLHFRLVENRANETKALQLLAIEHP
jgi:hypothetical protein